MSSNCARDDAMLYELAPRLRGYVTAATPSVLRRGVVPVLLIARDSRQRVIGRLRLGEGLPDGGKPHMLPPKGPCAHYSLLQP